MSNPFTTKDPLVDIIKQVMLGEKKLTDAELKKREEIAKAMERDNPGMDMGKKMAIATATAKEVAEEVNLQEITTKSGADVDRNLDDHDPDEHGDIPDRKPDHELETHGGLTLHVHHVKDSKGKTTHTIINHVHDPAGGGTYVVKGHAHPKHILSSYNRAEREDMDESVEQIDEVGNTLKGQIGLRDYKEKAKKDMGDAGEKLWYKSFSDKDTKGKIALIRQRDKRRKGIQRADARIKFEEVNLDEQLENFWEAYTTMFNEAEDQQQNILLRAMAKDPSDLMKMKRAIKMGDKALTNPALRQEILAMLDKMMHLTTGDPTLLQRTRMGFQKAKTKMPEEVENVDEGIFKGSAEVVKQAVRVPYRAVKRVAVAALDTAQDVGGAAKSIKKKFNEAIGAKDKQDEGEYGYEGDMAMSQLRTIIRNCQEMMKVLDKETDMPEWVQSKITLATDYLQTANDYLMSELEEAANPAQQAAIAIAMKKAGKKPKNEEVEQVDEASEKVVSGDIQRARQDVDYHKRNLDSMQKKISRGDKEIEHGRWKQLRQSDATKLQQQHKQADDELTKAHADVKKTAVSKFVASRKGDGKVRTEEVELGEADEKEVGKEVKAARLKKDSSDFMSKSSLFSGGARDVAKHLGKKDDEKYGEAMKKVKDTPVSKFVASRKGDGKVRTEEAEKAPFEGGREAKSSKPAAERVKKIAKGMQKHYTKDKK